MTAISIPECNNKNCEFLSLKEEVELSGSAKVNLCLSIAAIGIGAATNYLCGSNPISGALFMPLVTVLDRTLISPVCEKYTSIGLIDHTHKNLPLAFEVKDQYLAEEVENAFFMLGSLKDGVLTLGAIKVTSAVLDLLGFPISNFMQNVSLVTILIADKGFNRFCSSSSNMQRREEIDKRLHRAYHQIPCGCPDQTPEIEKAKRFIQNYLQKPPCETPEQHQKLTENFNAGNIEHLHPK